MEQDKMSEKLPLNTDDVTDIDDDEDSEKTSALLQPIYIIPLLANIALVASIETLCSHFDDDSFGEKVFPLPHWMFFLVSTVTSPTFIAVSKHLPSPNYALVFGSLFTTAGLISSTLLRNNPQNMLAFGLLTGTGVSISLSIASLKVAPYFVRKRNPGPALSIVMATGFLSLVIHPLVRRLLDRLGDYTFVALAPIVILSSAIPVLFAAYHGKNRNLKCRMYLQSCDDIVYDVEEAKSDVMVDSKCLRQVVPKPKISIKKSTSTQQWMTSFISLCIWLFWGSGVDSSWLSMTMRSPLTTSSAAISVHLLYSLAIFLAKLVTEPRQKFRFFDQPFQEKLRLNFACNYMYLGMLGINALLLVLLPGYTEPFNNQLLFNIGFALQFDDLCEYDECCRSKDDGRVITGLSLQYPEEIHNERKLLVDFCCLLCHLLSVFMMSCISVLFGLQISNFIIYILNCYPFSFGFSSDWGFVILSSASTVISFCQPDAHL